MGTTVTAALSPRQLAAEARELATHPEEWVSQVRLSADGRWYERIRADEDHEVWLISWLPGQETGFHDHGGSAGAFALAWGTLEERVPGKASVVGAGEVRAFGQEFVHNVRNTSGALAVSVHAYSPPLSTMTRYELTPDGLIPAGTESEEAWRPIGRARFDERS